MTDEIKAETPADLPATAWQDHSNPRLEAMAQQRLVQEVLEAGGSAEAAEEYVIETLIGDPGPVDAWLKGYVPATERVEVLNAFVTGKVQVEPFVVIEGGVKPPLFDDSIVDATAESGEADFERAAATLQVMTQAEAEALPPAHLDVMYLDDVGEPLGALGQIGSQDGEVVRNPFGVNVDFAPKVAEALDNLTDAEIARESGEVQP